VRLSPLGTAATTGLLYQPQLIDDGDCGAIGGMKIGRDNRNTWREPDPAPHCPQHILHDQTRARTQAAEVGNQRLTAASVRLLVEGYGRISAQPQIYRLGSDALFGPFNISLSIAYALMAYQEIQKGLVWKINRDYSQDIPAFF
jgi:hypothetical protein